MPPWFYRLMASHDAWMMLVATAGACVGGYLYGVASGRAATLERWLRRERVAADDLKETLIDALWGDDGDDDDGEEEDETGEGPVCPYCTPTAVRGRVPEGR